MDIEKLILLINSLHDRIIRIEKEIGLDKKVDVK
jgi:hypothetical protein